MSFTQKVKSREVDLALLLVAALWGASYLSAKSLTQHAPVLTVLSLRFIITSLAIAFIWSLKRERFTRPELALGIGLGTSQGLILFCETSGVAKTSATNAGLIISLAIIFTPIFESIAAKNWLPRPFFVATVVAVVGVALLVSDKGFAAPGLGDWLMLAAALFRALHVTAMGHLTAGKAQAIAPDHQLLLGPIGEGPGPDHVIAAVQHIIDDGQTRFGRFHFKGADQAQGFILGRPSQRQRIGAPLAFNRHGDLVIGDAVEFPVMMGGQIFDDVDRMQVIQRKEIF